MRGIVKFPGRLRIEGRYAYHLVVWGLVWFFVVSSHANQMSGQASFLSARGDLPIHTSSKTAKEFFSGLARQLAEGGKEL